MRATIAGLLFLVVSAGCDTRYQNTELRLVTAFAAKEMCSCSFVMNRDEDFCLLYVKQSVPVAKLTVDRVNKKVIASQGLLWNGNAHLVDERFGCVLDDDTAP